MKLIGLILAVAASVVGTDVILTASLRLLPASVDALANGFHVVLFTAQISIACFVCFLFWRVFSAAKSYRIAYLGAFPIAYGAHLAATHNPSTFIIACTASAFIAAVVALCLFYYSFWRTPEHD